MTRKEKKLYEQMRQYQPPEVETEKYCEMQKKAQAEIAKGKILPRLHLFERIWIQAEYLSIWFWITEGILLVAGIVYYIWVCTFSTPCDDRISGYIEKFFEWSWRTGTVLPL